MYVSYGYGDEEDNIEEHYIYDDDIDVFVNRSKGMMRVEAPVDKPLTKEQIIEICKKFATDM